MKARGIIGEINQVGIVQMNLNSIVAEIDAEISKLQQARRLLAGLTAAGTTSSGTTNAVLKGRKRKKMSAAARAKISAAQKKRWAKTKYAKKG
jgi:hypothetical protein